MRPRLRSRRSTLPACLLATPLLATLGSSGPGYAETIDFEGVPAGTVLETVFSADGIGPVGVRGVNPLLLDDPNAAVVFDSGNPTGEDLDLGTPNETCPVPGPGVGAGGEVGSPFENCVPLGNVLMIAEDLIDQDGNGLVDDPDDIDRAAIDGALVEFDFRALGSVTARSIDVLDIDGNSPDPRVELYAADGLLLGTFSIPNDMEDNGSASVSLGDVEGVAWMVVHLQGSGAVDAIRFEPEAGGGEGCTPGYWKQPHHFHAWSAYDPPGPDYADVFDVDASFDRTLLGALEQGGGKEYALGRHSTAALLNATNRDVSYALTPAEVMTIVQDAYATGHFESAKDELEAENEMGCPLGRSHDDSDQADSDRGEKKQKEKKHKKGKKGKKKGKGKKGKKAKGGKKR